MGMSGHFGSKADRDAAALAGQQQRDQEAVRVARERRKVAAQIVMAIVDKIVTDIVRPGPMPEERECYEMAGEVRALVPDLEALAKRILDVNDGVE